MASILDVAILLGKESTYGTPATLSDAFEGKADTYQKVHEYIDSIGFRGGMETLRSDRRNAIAMGGEGSLELDILTTGWGFLLQAMLGSVSGPTQIAATTAYKTTATSTAADPDDSFTVQIQRVDALGTLQSYTHHGGVITGWSLKQDVGGLLVANYDFDFEDVDTSTGNGTPAYAASNSPFDWTMAACTLDSVATDIQSFELTADLALKTDRHFLNATSPLKKQPIRTGMPVYEGTISLEHIGVVEYADFVAGTIIPITMTWTGAVIESAEVEEVVITLAACQYTGNEPVSSLTDTPVSTLPFKVLDNGTAAAVVIEYTSVDTAL